ncbi:MAG: GldG family protein [Anaerolineae bacterium]|nr:GldG family protein [Anaerolineae bacterium]
MQNESVTITRNQIGQWASFLGGTALLIGVVGFIWQGGLSPVIIGSFAIAAAMLLLWFIMTPREVKAFLTGRQAQYSTGAVFGTLLLVGIISLGYVVLQRSVITLDMTESQRFTISNETREVLRRISRPIQLTGFYSARALQLREIDDQFFRLYEVESNGMVRRQYIDPDEQPALVQRYGAVDGQVYISYLNEDGSVDFSTLARVPRSESQERDVTEAISRLLISGSLTVYFSQENGELDPLSADPQGLSGINNGIQESGLITYPLSLKALAASGGNVPQDASALIMARPTTDLTDGEIAVIDRYLERGGALFIMTDVLFNENSFMQENGLFNQYLWVKFGIRALDAAIVDEVSYSGTQLDVVSAAIFPENDIAERLDQENAPTLFKIARALETNQTPPADTPNGNVIMSSPQSYGERDLKTLGETNNFGFDPNADIPGPLASVIWAYNQNSGAKILMVGDSDFVTNSVIQTGGNGILFTDGLTWLTGLGERIKFAPQAYGSGLPVIFVGAEQIDLIAFITVILMPGIVLATGIGIWLRRVRA